MLILTHKWDRWTQGDKFYIGKNLKSLLFFKFVIPAPIFIGINSSSVSSRNDRNPEGFEITGLPPEFTPYLSIRPDHGIRGGSDELRIIRGSLRS